MSSVCLFGLSCLINKSRKTQRTRALSHHGYFLYLYMHIIISKKEIFTRVLSTCNRVCACFITEITNKFTLSEFWHFLHKNMYRCIHLYIKNMIYIFLTFTYNDAINRMLKPVSPRKVVIRITTTTTTTYCL